MAKAFPLFAIDPRGNVASNATLMLHTRIAEMYRFANYVDDVDRVDELHNMRIAAKRLRYTMEIFASSFPGEDFATLYENVKSIQEQIGDIHDCDVRVPLMRTYLSEEGERRPEIKFGLERAIIAEQTKRNKLYEKFRRYWRKLQENAFHHTFLELLVRAEDKSAEPAAISESTGQATQRRSRSRSQREAAGMPG